ncbi:MAG: ABC transporter substrate-binding protein [Synergistaceae bacterium]|nr:ABC transporter substrate-binding protein [Synergistaceae bacterium]
MKKLFLTLVLVLWASTAIAAEPIKVGYLTPLTGVSAAFGIAEINMVKIAVDEINSAGGVLGRPIELIIYDTKCRNEDAINAVRRMVDNDKVVAILGSIQSGIEIATASITNNAKVPRISTGATNPFVTVDTKGKVRPYSFRICFTDPYQGALAAELANELHKTKAAILYNVGSDYAHGLREYFTKDFKALGGQIVADEGFMDADVDYRAQLTKIKTSGADVLWLPGNGKDMALTLKQMEELGLDDITVIGSDSYGEFMNEIAGNAMVGTYWINHTYLEDPNMAPVFKKYKEVYNDECKEFVFATMGYDATYWLADAITRAGKVDREAIRDALENTKNLQLKHCVLTINPEDHNPYKKSGVILKVDNDLKAKFYKKIEPK